MVDQADEAQRAPLDGLFGTPRARGFVEQVIGMGRLEWDPESLAAVVGECMEAMTFKSEADRRAFALGLSRFNSMLTQLRRMPLSRVPVRSGP